MLFIGFNNKGSAYSIKGTCESVQGAFMLLTIAGNFHDIFLKGGYIVPYNS